jgi:hypothetical protein
VHLVEKTTHDYLTIDLARDQSGQVPTLTQADCLLDIKGRDLGILLCGPCPVAAAFHMQPHWNKMHTDIDYLPFPCFTQDRKEEGGALIPGS